MAYNIATLALAAKVANDTNHKFNMFRGIQRDTGLWEDMSEEDKHAKTTAVKAIFDNPKMRPEECHKLWVENMLKAGWHYDQEYSQVDKTHPCMATYAELPDTDKLKDEMYLSVVSAFAVL